MNTKQPMRVSATVRSKLKHRNKQMVDLISVAVLHIYATGDTHRANMLFEALATQGNRLVRESSVSLLKSLLPYEVKEVSKNLFKIPEDAKRDDAKHRLLTNPEDEGYWEAVIDRYCECLQDHEKNLKQYTLSTKRK